jgi:hypothetical protein
VEIDSRSILTTYKEYIGAFEGIPQNLKFDISQLLYTDQPDNSGTFNLFKKDDAMLSKRQINGSPDMIESLLLPR